MGHKLTRSQRKALAQTEADAEDCAASERFGRERRRGESYGRMPIVPMPEEPVTTWSNIVYVGVPSFETK
jgi:hypothetical protein